MGNQISPQKSTTIHNLHNHKNDIISISAKLREGRSSSSKHISSSDEQLIIDLKHMNMMNEMKKNKECFDNDKSVGIPTVFRWHGKGEKIYISGSFNNWKEKIHLKKSDTVYYTIINCLPGHQSYKFHVDGEWVHDVTQPTEVNSFGTLNNWLEVVEEDFNLDLALSHDEKFSRKTSESESVENPNAEYGQIFPQRPNLSTDTKLCNITPNFLPPYLNETVLNMEDSQHTDPILLRAPVYVQINHLYASSITSGIAALSVTIRYRTKFITTIFYKPIS